MASNTLCVVIAMLVLNLDIVLVLVLLHILFICFSFGMQC